MSLPPKVDPQIDGRHMGTDKRLASRAARAAGRIIEMGHSGMVTLESSLLAQARLNESLQRQINRLTGRLKAADALALKRAGQLEKAHLYITDLKLKLDAEAENHWPNG